MQTISLSEIEAKTLELCEAIVTQPSFAPLFKKLESFMSDEAAKYQFQSINDLGQLLQQKQSSGLSVEDHEVAEFETLRDNFMSNSVARDFLDAQEEVQKIQSTIYKQLAKTFELGRVPTPEDFAGDCCSSNGCGCN